MSSSDRAPRALHLAYLTSQYPATSHTFISREVAAVRDLGVRLDTFSIRPSSSAELKDELVQSEASKTFVVLRRPARELVAAHLSTLCRNPAGYAQTLFEALRHRPPGLKALALSVAHFGEAILLARELKQRGVTHLHNHFANSAATVGYLAARLLQLPWSFTMHGISETDYPAGLLLGRKIKAATFVACVSYFGRAQAMRCVEPRQWSKLHIVRCGLPLASIECQRTRKKNQRIICVGRLSPEKGQAGLLEAFASLAGEMRSLQLVFVGDGPEAASLRKIARHRQLDDRVIFSGRLGEHETLDYIARSDVLVLPSFMEGLPIVLLEAMALGTAVIASRVAGIPELIDDGKNGLLFTPSNWQELADCIRRMLSNDGLRARLAADGRKRLSPDFDIEQSAQQLQQLFEAQSPT